jgi:hypothetical protein
MRGSDWPTNRQFGQPSGSDLARKPKLALCASQFLLLRTPSKETPLPNRAFLRRRKYLNLNCPANLRIHLVIQVQVERSITVFTAQPPPSGASGRTARDSSLTQYDFAPGLLVVCCCICQNLFWYASTLFFILRSR